MGTIKEIIEAIDNELISSDKEYLLLSQANRILVDKIIFTVSEKADKTLKKLLEEKKIPHAYQTKYSPKQWRIPLSTHGEILKKNAKKSMKEKKKGEDPVSFENFQQTSFSSNTTICPSCGFTLFIPAKILHENYLQCLTCGNYFKNPYKEKFKHTYVGNNVINNTTNIELQKEQFLKYATLFTFGIGFFFFPIWILTAILFLLRILRK